MIVKPKILIVFSKQASETSTRFGGFVKRIQKNGGFEYADVAYVALENLLFHIQDTQHARVYDPVSGIEVGDYSFVYFKSWQSMPETAASVAFFLEGKGIPYADHQVRHEYIAKTTNYMAMWAHGVSVPETVWGSSPVLKTYLTEMDDARFPVILKAVHGQKGKDNFLVHTKAEALKTVETTQAELLLQAFIPNGGDYRIGVYGHKSRWAIYRKSGGTSHLNNTSAGGTALEMPIEEVPKAVRTLAERAANACDLAVSGVDVVEHAVTKELFIFEANQGSQIVTGAFTESNMTAFDKGMKAMASRRFKNGISSTQRLEVIGRRVHATLVLGAERIEIQAKVDTGAYRSALDAIDIQLLTDAEGVEYLQYTVLDLNAEGRTVTVSTYDFDRALIYSSTGHADRRFDVPMVLEIHGQEYTTRVTLAKRSKHKNQALLGRTLLRGNFIVNVELGL